MTRDSAQHRAEDTYYQQRIEVLAGLKHELGVWARTRFWIMAALMLVVAVLVAGVMARYMVAEELQSAANALPDAAVDSGGADARNDSAPMAASTRQAGLEVLSERLSGLEADQAALSAEPVDAPAETARGLLQLQARIQSLEQRVTQMLTELASAGAPGAAVASADTSAAQPTRTPTDNSGYPVYLLITPETAARAEPIGAVIASAGFDLQPYSGSLQEFESLVAIPDGSFINARNSFVVHSAGHRQAAAEVAGIIETHGLLDSLDLIQDQEETPSAGVVVFIRPE